MILAIFVREDEERGGGRRIYLHRDNKVTEVPGVVGRLVGVVVQFKRVGEAPGWIQLGDEHVVAWSVTLLDMGRLVLGTASCC